MESERAVAEGDAGLDALHSRVGRKRRGETADGDAGGGDGEAAVVPPAALGWRFAVDGIYPSRHAVARFDVDVDTSEKEEGEDSSNGGGVFDRPCLVLKGAASPFVRSAHLPTIARRFPR